MMNHLVAIVVVLQVEESQVQDITCTSVLPASGRLAATTVNVMDRWEYCRRVLHTSGPYETFMAPLLSSDSAASK